MKRIILLVLAVLIIPSQTFGATSQDLSVYVRKDVFEVYMQNINSNMEKILDELKSQRLAITELKQDVSVLSARIDGIDTRLSARIDGIDAKLSARIDGLDTRVGDLRNDIYLGLVILGIVVSLPTVQKLLQAREKQTSNSPSAITLDDVRRLIEENNVKLHQKFQA